MAAPWVFVDAIVVVASSSAPASVGTYEFNPVLAVPYPGWGFGTDGAGAANVPPHLAVPLQEQPCQSVTEQYSRY